MSIDFTNMEELTRFLQHVCEDSKKLTKLIHNKNRNIEIEIRFDAVDKTKAAAYFATLDPTTQTSVTEVNCGTTVGKEIRKRHFPREKYSETKEVVCFKHFPDLYLSVHSNIETRFDECLDVSKLTPRVKERRSDIRDSHRVDVTRVTKEARSVWMVEIEVTSEDVDVDMIVKEVSRISPLIMTENLASSMGRAIHWTKPREAFTYDFTQTGFFSGDVYATAKLDGVRKSVWVKDEIVYCGSETEPYREYGRTTGPDCVLDAELYDHRIYPFDVLEVGGQDFTQRKFRHRVETTKTLTKLCGFCWKEQYLVKSFAAIPDIVRAVRTCGLITDGIIFTKGSGTYATQPLKWKYSPTIDVYIKDEAVYARKNRNMVKVSERQGPKDVVGIYECEVPQHGPLTIVRERRDKVAPNSYQVVINIIHSIERKLVLSPEGLCGETSELLRAYHNRVKRKLLEEVKYNLIDIGSGTGGDVGKWRPIRHVYAVEPNAQSFSVLQTRVGSKKVTLNHCLGQDISMDKIKRVSHVSLFFSLNAMGVDGFVQLLQIFEQHPDKFIHHTVNLLILFMEWPGGSTDFGFATLREIDDRYAETTIHGSKVIGVREEKMTVTGLLHVLQNQGYTDIVVYTVNQETFLSAKQIEFTSMYKCIKATRVLN